MARAAFAKASTRERSGCANTSCRSSGPSPTGRGRPSRDRPAAPLSILLTNLLLAGRTGTEIVTRRLAGALRDLGHHPTVYTPQPGALADELLALSGPVVSDIREVLGPVDTIHGHHLPTTVAALARWPHTPALFVCHDFVAWHDQPPMFPSIRRYIAVDDTVAGRLRDAGVDEARLRIVLNQPDLDRFVPGPPLPEHPGARWPSPSIASTSTPSGWRARPAAFTWTSSAPPSINWSSSPNGCSPVTT